MKKYHISAIDPDNNLHTVVMALSASESERLVIDRIDHIIKHGGAIVAVFINGIQSLKINPYYGKEAWLNDHYEPIALMKYYEWLERNMKE